MERLTKRLPSGAADYNYPASCYFVDDSGPDRIAQSAFRQRCVEQLADYEDTRLTPEQCKNAKVIIESAFSNDTSKAERIRELLKADKDGRLVVLPCKVGDTVYWLHNGFITECRVHRIQMNRTGLFICLKSKVSQVLMLPPLRHDN
jgi:hypothetical protein